MAAQESWEVRRWIQDVRSVDAVARGLVLAAVADPRIDHVNASMSSRMMEWMRRCRLLCRDESNK